jgi:TorA maturation chaperone TorD
VPTSAPALRALARSRAWMLLGDFFANGVTTATRPAWEQAAPGVPLEHDHTRLYLLELAPYESVFLSDDGLVGGEIAANVREAQAQSGLPMVKEPDHLTEELKWLGFLSGAEADALRDGAPVEHIRMRARDALDEHLLRWLPAFAAAVDGADPAPIDCVAIDMALALAWEQRASLGAAPPAWELPPEVAVLDQPRAGLRAIAEHFALPCQAGGWLSRAAITRIGRQLDLPTTFGARADMIEGLLGSAAHYGRVPEVADALGGALLTARFGAPAGLDALVRPWVIRRHTATDTLERVSRAARASSVAD